MSVTSAHASQAELAAAALELFPGGVNSPVRAFRSVGRPPLLLAAGEGPRVRDADARWYLDYIGAWGPAILGHAAPEVVTAVRDAASDGFALGATSPREIELGRLIRDAMPSMERLRFTSSGTEAAMSALRLARGATGRDLVIKFAGGYHGHSDGLLVEAGSGVAASSKRLSFQVCHSRWFWLKRTAPPEVAYTVLDSKRKPLLPSIIWQLI